VDLPLSTLAGDGEIRELAGVEQSVCVSRVWRDEELGTYDLTSVRNSSCLRFGAILAVVDGSTDDFAVVWRLIEGRRQIEALELEIAFAM